MTASQRMRQQSFSLSRSKAAGGQSLRGISCLLSLLCVGAWLPAALSAAETLPAATEVEIRAAISKALPLLEAGSKGSADQRQCFTCHNQAVPVLALAEVRQRGIAIDEDNFQRQVGHSLEHLKRGQSSYLAGTGQGGKVLAAGYALWTLEAGAHAADETTAAVAHFLLEYQKDKSHWSHSGSRPPSSGSDFTATYVALRGLAAFGTAEQQPPIKARREQIGQWLLSETPHDTEDRVFRLWSLPYLDQSAELLEKATSELIALQQADGGWAQNAELPSDAYATATVLVALLDPGKVAADRETIRRGVRYLLTSQLEDGSWHVTTRAKPFQPYFETGFPHGKDQFISVAASGWATLALALTLPAAPAPEPASAP